MDEDFKFDEWPELKKLIPQFNRETKIVRCQPMPDFRIHTTSPFKWSEAKEIWHDQNGAKARGWRIIGSIFNRDDWFKKGRRCEKIPAVPIETESIQIKQAIVMNVCREWYVGYFGYCASIDTLIVSGALERIDDPFATFPRI